MFDFLLSEEKKMRRHAANWLEVADRVHHFRRDELNAAQTQKLAAATGEVRSKLKEKADASRLKLAIEKLEAVLRETGGRHYPMGSMAENVEFFLVAALVILGLRAYFVQPFKIPTNSMWPSYYGMTHELTPAGEEPGMLAQAGRLIAYGATHHRVDAPADGEVYVPVVPVSQTQPKFVYLGSEAVGRFLGVFPSASKEWTFMVGGQSSLAKISLPADFDFERVIEEKLAGSGGNLSDFLLGQARQAGRNPESSIMTFVLGGQRRDLRVYWLPTGLKVRRGESIVSFDQLTGDLLFVDRLTYNFLPPKVGQGFVFKTENIDSPEMQDAAGNQIRQYYIKRLAGVPGDQVEIRAPQLLRNGAPISGADAFGWNAQKKGLYPGYTNERLLAAGQQVTVPAHGYLALGDNSPRSKDSRYWGYVPEKDVVGKPLFIYYPLSRRWGPAN